MLKIITSAVDNSSSPTEQNNSSFQNDDRHQENNSNPCVIALGNFDGIHQGHQKVIEPIFQPRLNQEYSRCLVTFTPHPQEFFSGNKKLLLTPIAEKSQLLEQMGIDQLILLPFDRELANLTPSDFVSEILVKKINASFISIGEDFRFGYRRQGDAEQLKLLAIEHQIEVNITPEQSITVEDRKQRISSSLIRKSLSQGEIEFANQMLGREYKFIGTVVKGQQLGRTIGFPTANLQIPQDKFIPQKGVYEVRVDILDSQETNLIGVMNIGNRPTIDGQNISIEVHLLNWQGDLYGKQLKVRLVKFIREEKKFASLDELKEQIKKDCQSVISVNSKQ